MSGKLKMVDRKKIAARKRARRAEERKQFGATIQVFPMRDIHPDEAAKVLLSRSFRSSSR